MLSSPSFSPHNDVLNATPETSAAKSSLVEELKRRGRVSVTTHRYPDAKDLYGKAIEVLSSTETDGAAASKNTDLAILHSNRALCFLQMNRPNDSYEDATSATCFDSTYVKGFWRLGQASMALKQTQEAIDAYKTALMLDPSSKALKKEFTNAEKQLVKDKVEAERLEKEKEENANYIPPPVAKKVQVVKDDVPSSSSSSAGGIVKDDKIAIKSDLAGGKGEFSKSDHVRGYKIVNGKKTSFFHHEMTEEEKHLIGDITPKRLEPTQMSDSSATTQDKDVSVWNKAGTWEEKDVTDWAIGSVKGKVLEASYQLPGGSPDPNASVKVIDVSGLISSKKAGGSAHASVAKVRGKKKYIFEFTICVHWEMTLGSGDKCKGKLTFYDVDGTHEIGEGYDISEYSVEDGAQADARHLLDRFVRNGGLRSEIEKKLDEWIGLFQETY
jgi:tetratricopeptide (TPR) repeat protein